MLFASINDNCNTAYYSILKTVVFSISVNLRYPDILFSLIIDPFK